MSRPRSARSVPLVLLGALLLALAGCGSPAPSAVPAATAPNGDRRVEIAFAGGAVTGGVQRYAVPVNATVELVVSSDVADEVHVHGYDLMQDVTPDAPATVTFDATIPGVFEVELEELGRQLLTLQVQ